MNSTQGGLLVGVLQGLLDHASQNDMPKEEVLALDGKITELASHLGVDDGGVEQEQPVELPTEQSTTEQTTTDPAQTEA